MDTYERDNLSVEPLSDHDAEEEDLLSNPGTVIKEKQMEKNREKRKKLLSMCGQRRQPRR